MRRLSLLVLLCSGCFLRLPWTTDWPEPVEAHRVVTDDGWSLDLRRVTPTSRAHPRPVIVLHGIVTNGRNMDLDHEHSLARWMAERGFDVWVPSLRGTGLSEHRDEDYGFDAYAAHDLPALVSYVRQQTGADEVDFVGHSMGGLVLYAYLARGGTGIARAVTLGSPVKLRWTGRLEALVRSAGWLGSVARWPLATAAHASMPIHGSWDGPVERLLINPALTDEETWRRLMAVGVDDVPPGLLAQFNGWLERDRFDSLDRKIDYLAGLEEVRVPMLIVAAKIDGIAPPWNVRPAFDRLGSEEKAWVVVGEANGMSADYNHMDLLLAKAARKDVFPGIARWLTKGERR